MLFSDEERFKKPMINHPIDRQILCHIKPNTEVIYYLRFGFLSSKFEINFFN